MVFFVFRQNALHFTYVHTHVTYEPYQMGYICRPQIFGPLISIKSPSWNTTTHAHVYPTPLLSFSFPSFQFLSSFSYPLSIPFTTLYPFLFFFPFNPIFFHFYFLSIIFFLFFSISDKISFFPLAIAQLSVVGDGTTLLILLFISPTLPQLGAWISWICGKYWWIFWQKYY